VGRRGSVLGEHASADGAEGLAARGRCAGDDRCRAAVWSQIEQRNPFFNERARKEITEAGVPGDKVDLLMQPVSSTHEEAELVKQYAVDHALKSVLIVTSAYHSRRALWTFSRVFRDTGIQVGLIRVDPGDQSPRPATWWLTRRGWRFVPTEYVKLLYYVVKYR